MNIQMVDLRGQYEKIREEINSSIIEVIEQSAFIKGPAVKKFSKDFASYNNVKKVIPCGNGTDALQIALMALDLKPGDEVIVPAFTYVAPVEVIALLGLKPVFVDVNYSNYNIKVDQIEKVISPSTKVILPVHLYGQCAPMETILQIAKKHNLYVIEDTAQAISSQYTFSDGLVKYAGTIGSLGCTSFFPSKNLGCYGDGGAILTNDENLGEICEMIGSHGQKEKYYHNVIGVNSRLDTIQAAILNIKLKYLNDYSAARQKAASFYDEELSSLPDIITPKKEVYSTHVYHQYTIQVEEGIRDDLKLFLKGKGVPTMIYYPVPLHLQKAYSSYDYKEGDFPTAEKLCRSVLSLPIHTEMTTDQQEYIINIIRSYFNG